MPVRRFKKKYIVILLLIVCMVTASGVIAFLVLRPSPQIIDQKEYSTSVIGNDGKYKLTLEQLPEDKLREKTEQFTFTKQFDEAAQLIQYQDTFETSQSNHLLLATVYRNGEMTDEALDVYLKIEEKFGLDLTIARDLAELYAVKNNGEQARRYYDKTIELIRASDDPLGEWEVEQIERKKAELS